MTQGYRNEALFIKKRRSDEIGSSVNIQIAGNA
jgi:hypothetical protein